MSAGYSGTPLAERLGLAEGMRVGLDDPPPEFVGIALLPVPAGITMHTHLRGNMDLVIGFYRRRADLERRLPVMRRRIDADGAIWIAWPARVPTDMSEDAIREAGAAAGLIAAGTCKIDEVWSALRLEVAAPDRDGDDSA